ncbi:TetR family transcriptional regulator [Saccharopolyspora sp. HNM0986]|uniref:TetR/AcrR family transcriptional regulator n=1 Tax=Saccharopolyspora galaxeae TaxID=2781241 RepID=UPI001909E1A4|nr:TetR family transcriptional regulator [Saccharopolyspora sp. HNM0986]MBK0869095.1 TetR family transcriptional regulator [Saccharopolyspora sp. HNM0986]
MGRARRFDPDRRTRIIDAALATIAEDGVAGTSHRKVAARADVPLGSMTYHFADREELLRAAFSRFCATISGRFEDRLTAARGPEEAREAVVGIIHEDVFATRDDLVLTHELYALAAREPAYRDLVADWMSHSHKALRRHFGAHVAREIDALIEGLTIHRSFGTRAYDRGLTRDALRRITSPPEAPG